MATITDNQRCDISSLSINGRLECILDLTTDQSQVSRIFSRYPLKLLLSRCATGTAVSSPLTSSDEDGFRSIIRNSHGAALVYLMGFGGGLVSGDEVRIDPVQVREGASLILTTPSFTQIYKGAKGPCKQFINIIVEKEGTFCLLPQPISCCQNASFNQALRIRLHDVSSSCIILDIITSGRANREFWDFNLYISSVKITQYESKLIGVAPVLHVVDHWKFEKDDGHNFWLRERLGPYHLYANLFLVGPRFAEERKRISQAFDRIIISKQVISQSWLNGSSESSSVDDCPISWNPDRFLWSASVLKGNSHSEDMGMVVRIAAMSVEEVYEWLAWACPLWLGKVGSG